LLNSRHRKVERVAFTPDGGHLLASGLHSGSLGYGDADSGIDVWDLAGGPEVVSRLLEGHHLRWFAPLPDGRLVVAAEPRTEDAGPRERLAVIDRHNGQGMAIPTEHGWSAGYPCAVSADGRRLVARLVGRQARPNRSGRPTLEQAIGCWDLPPKGKPRLAWQVSLGRDREARPLALAPDGRTVWTGEWATAPTPPLWWIEFVPRDAATGAATAPPVAYPNEHLTGLAFTPDGRVAVAHHGPSLFVYDAAAPGRKPRKVTNPAKRKSFGGFAFHPSGRWLAAAGLDGAVTVWETESWRVARGWDWGAGQARSVAFSADGALAAAGTGSGTVVVWDVDD
jgi:WD40 repeat protein